MTIDIASISHEMFAPHLGQTFRFVAPEDGSVITEVELTKLTPRPECTPRWAKRTSFSALFETYGISHLWNGYFQIDHPTTGLLGPFYIVRIIPRDPERGCFELVLN
ncbi:DUF6916 family protein [Azospirillum brasilense]|uniref:DUF6916 family protein n=1 Tax=Azospirillum brasilense TaxID=192 RepID=UPI000E0C31A9|nr:hypothetical protein [Azospirillum brasilense]